jgi:hypothetical protein
LCRFFGLNLIPAIFLAAVKVPNNRMAAPYDAWFKSLRLYFPSSILSPRWRRPTIQGIKSKNAVAVANVAVKTQRSGEDHVFHAQRANQIRLESANRL